MEEYEKTIQLRFEEFVEDWARKLTLMKHDRKKNPRFFLTKGYVGTGAEDFAKHARPETSPCVQMSSARSITGAKEECEYYAFDLYFCVRADKMGDAHSEDDATDYADYIRKLFKCYFMRERDELYNPLLEGGEVINSVSVPRFHDAWVAVKMTVVLAECVDLCLDEGLLEEDEDENDGDDEDDDE